MTNNDSWPVIHADEIDFSNATPVVTGAQKFVVPVPRFANGGEPLVYPQGHEHSGEPILARDESPLGDKGVVFWNAKDNSWQAAAGDGSHVVIINDVSEREAMMLHESFGKLGGVERITLEEFKGFLAHAADIGLSDTYQSDFEYVKANMTPVSSDALQLEYAGVTMGFLERDDHAIACAYYKEGSFEFINVTGVTQKMPNGGVIVRLGDDVHAIQPNIFQKTYRLAEHGRTVQDCAVDIERLE